MPGLEVLRPVAPFAPQHQLRSTNAYRNLAPFPDFEASVRFARPATYPAPPSCAPLP